MNKVAIISDIHGNMQALEVVLEDIKKVGVYKGSVRLHPEVNVEFKIWVVSKA